MTGGDRQHLEGAALGRLVHDLANPLSAVLAEAQLLLLDAEYLSPDAQASLRAIETAALRMRAILRETSAQRKP